MVNWSTPNDSGDERRRARAAEMPEIPALDSHRFRLVVEIILDTGARQDDDACGQGVQHRIVALERSGLLVPVPVGLERDLRHIALIGPEGGDLLAACRRCAMRQDTLGMFGVDTVEKVPDGQMIVEEIGSASGGDQECKIVMQW